MTEGEFTEIGAAILDERFPEVDLMLRRGRHIDREDTSLYAYLSAAQAVLEALYRRFGCELVHKSDGYFYLLPTGDQLGRRQLSVSEMLVGQALALLYLDPRTLQSGGNVPRQEVLVHLASVMGTDALLRAFNPTKKKKIDERVAQETVRNRVAEALRKLATLGFVELLEGDQLRLRAALMRFAEPVRGLESPLEALQKLVAKGEVVLSVGDDSELDAGDDPEGDGAGDDAESDDSESDDSALPESELGDDDLGAEFDVQSDESAELGEESDDADEDDADRDEEQDAESNDSDSDSDDSDDSDEEETERDFAPGVVTGSLDAEGFEDEERADDESADEGDSEAELDSDAEGELDSDAEGDDAQDGDSDEPDSDAAPSLEVAREHVTPHAVAAPDAEHTREPVTANAIELAPDTASNTPEVAHDSPSESDDEDGEPDDEEPDSDGDDDEPESDEIDEAQAAFDAEIQRARELHEALWEPFAQADQHSASASTPDADAAPPTLNSETQFDESEVEMEPLAAEPLETESLDAEPLTPEPDRTKPAADEAPVKESESLEPPL